MQAFTLTDFPTWLPGTAWLAHYREGCIITVNKPLHKTSFQIVAGIKHKLRISSKDKIKIGHAGTLDPLADGVLVICIGKATKTINEIQAMEKSYRARIMFGATRPSYDKETEIDQEFAWQHIDEELLKKHGLDFLGEQLMVPPIHSAVKIGGVRSYKLARRGENPVLEAKPIVIHDMQILHVNLPAFECDIKCSKGTYIRSIANEFGKRLDSGAYLDALTRSAVGIFTLESAWDFDIILNELESTRQR